MLKDCLKKNFDWQENTPNWSLQETVIFGRLSRNIVNSKAQNPPESTKLVLQSALKREIKKIPELSIRNENGRFAIHFHAFRKYFRTVLGNVCGRDYAEALMGHGSYIDTYYQLPDEKKRQMYMDAELHLTMSDFVAVENNLKKLSEKNSQLEEKFNDLLQYLQTNKINIPNFK